MKPQPLALLALCTLACDAVPSADLDTQEIRADYQIVAESDGLVQVEAQLRLAGTALTFVDLGAGDTLLVDDGLVASPLDDVRAVFDAITYTTRAPVRPGPVQVRLHRRDWPNALESWVVLPRPFALRASHRDYIVGLDDIPLLWSGASSHPVRIAVEGACLRDDDWTVPDEGFFVITPHMLRVRASWRGDRCPVEITVERLYEGAVDPALAGGRFTAVQRRATRVDLYR